MEPGQATFTIGQHSLSMLQRFIARILQQDMRIPDQTTHQERVEMRSGCEDHMTELPLPHAGLSRYQRIMFQYTPSLCLHLP